MQSELVGNISRPPIDPNDCNQRTANVYYTQLRAWPGQCAAGWKTGMLCNLGVVGSAQGWALDIKRIASSLSLNFSQPLQTPPFLLS